MSNSAQKNLGTGWNEDLKLTASGGILGPYSTVSSVSVLWTAHSGQELREQVRQPDRAKLPRSGQDDQ
jgi:hypothetical protein